LIAQIAIQQLKRETANEFANDPSPLFFSLLRQPLFYFHTNINSLTPDTRNLTP